jgi:predicted MFS family arabinose efflux permease
MTPRPSLLTRRLAPLYVAVGLQGFMLWVPVEKLFMNEIGFDVAAVGVMAAAYAAFVPLVEVPSGILADRWSRRGVLVLATVALALTALLGGASTNVPMYIVSMLALGVYFAMFTGTMDSIVYDTVLEETGDSSCFERLLGRVRLVESVSLVGSALLGGWVAGLASPRLTYFLTVPFALLAVIAFLRFREPRLHRTEGSTPLRHQLAVTYRVLTTGRRLPPIVALAVLTSLVSTTIFEFGPLWLVALAVPAVVFGPYWAGLMSTIGLGGLLAGRLPLDRPAARAVASGVTIVSALTLTTGAGPAATVVAQIALVLVVMVASIHVTRMLHDSVPSAVRAGVASGVSAISWIAFLPFSLAAGVVSRQHGIQAAGWMVTVVAVLAGVLWVSVSVRPRARTAGARAAVPACPPPIPARAL